MDTKTYVKRKIDSQRNFSKLIADYLNRMMKNADSSKSFAEFSEKTETLLKEASSENRDLYNQLTIFTSQTFWNENRPINFDIWELGHSMFSIGCPRCDTESTVDQWNEATGHRYRNSMTVHLIDLVGDDSSWLNARHTCPACNKESAGDRIIIREHAMGVVSE